MKKTLLATLVAIFCTANAVAQQSAVPISRIRQNIEQCALHQLSGHAEWGMASLRRNVHSLIPSAVARTMVLPEAGKTVMTPQELYMKRQNGALIFGKTYMCGECPNLHVALIATATAVTEDGVCLTNYHMVHPIVSKDANVSRGDSVYFVADRDGQCYPIVEVLSYDTNVDMAAVRVDTQGNKLDAIPLGDVAETGQHINLISHPKQMFYMYTQGYVTRNSIYNFADHPRLDLLEISADFAEGSSGGPILDDCGNLVAMVRGTNTIYYDDSRTTPQMVLKVTIPVKTLRKLLK